MKKIVTFVLVLAVVFCAVSAVSMSAAAKVSPTAPTITRPTGGDDVPTVPSSPHVTTTTPSGSTAPSTGTTGPSASRPTTTPSNAGSTAKPIVTAPGGSTVTGTVKPDDNPTAPETGDTSMEVFVFAGVAMACSAAAILLKKNKENEQ